MVENSLASLTSCPSVYIAIIYPWLKDELRKRDQEADAILDEVTSRTEQFIAMNEKKEAELERQRKTIQQFERRLANDQLTPDKQIVKKLQDELELAQKNYKGNDFYVIW